MPVSLPKTEKSEPLALVLRSDCGSLLTNQLQGDVQSKAFNGHEKCHDNDGRAVATQCTEHVDLALAKIAITIY